MKRPAFQFYPGDWLHDAGLRACSTGARGLWMDMLCYMHQSNPYGYLMVGGKVILPSNLARMSGETLQNVEGWLDELEQFGVCSKTDGGAYYSRRMIRDEEIREKRASGGHLGGNPILIKATQKVNHQPNLKPTPSSSSSSSKETTTTTLSPGVPIEKGIDPDGFGMAHGHEPSISKPRSGQTRMTVGWRPSPEAMGMYPAYGVNLSPAEIDASILDFVSHYSKEGSKTSSDWDGELRTWLLREQRYILGQRPMKSKPNGQVGLSPLARANLEHEHATKNTSLDATRDQPGGSPLPERGPDKFPADTA